MILLCIHALMVHRMAWKTTASPPLYTAYLQPSKGCVLKRNDSVLLRTWIIVAILLLLLCLPLPSLLLLCLPLPPPHTHVCTLHLYQYVLTNPVVTAVWLTLPIMTPNSKGNFIILSLLMFSLRGLTLSQTNNTLVSIRRVVVLTETTCLCTVLSYACMYTLCE